MAKRNKLSHFFNELQRRNVYKVVAMYAATAFIILQLVDIITPALSLPHWILIVVIVLLAIGFPVTAILSWIFDITPKGIEKTEAFDEIKAEGNVIKARRKFKISDGIIIVLLIVVVILAYPKIFKKDNLKSIRDPEGKISVAVMPFENITGDSLFNVWSGGFQNLLIGTLSDSKELVVRHYQAVNNVIDITREVKAASIAPSLGKNVANTLEAKTYILGNIMSAGNKIRINAKLIDAETDEIYKSYQVDGHSEDELFSMADSLSNLIKNYIEIKKIKDERNALDLRGTSQTNSSDAYKYYINGFDAFMDMEMKTAEEWFLRSINADSNFISPVVSLSFTYRQMGQNIKSKYWFNKVWDRIKDTPLEQELILRHLNAFYNETPEEEIRYLEQLTEIDELNTIYWHQLGLAYSRQYDFENALENWEKTIEIPEKWGSYYHNPYIYPLMGNAYHKTNEHDKEEKILAKGLSYIPENFLILQQQAICAFSTGNNLKGEKIIEEYRAMRKANLVCTDAMISTGMGYIYSESKQFDRAENYYRKSLELEPNSLLRMNNLAWFLIDSEVNVQEGIELISRALEILPEHYILLDTKGWGLYKLGKFQAALELLEQAWENRTSYNHNIKLHLEELKNKVREESSI